ncbi:MAG: hypothetical protein KGJ06_09395 [Pseudomonadota bacterium]|nr:hypothetical protein [Pseudomonadota bacterium]
MDEPPRVYDTDEQINAIVAAALSDIKEAKIEGHRLAQGLFKCNFPPAEGQLQFKDQDLVKPGDIERADIICLDGIHHVQNAIGAVPVKSRQFFMEKGVWPENASVLTYDSNVEKKLRFDQEYRWIKEKNYVSPEMDELAGRIFQAKFIKDDNLVPPDQFQGFCFLTYSFGNRMAEMVENGLRHRLREEGADDHTIQRYFDRIKMVSIASSVDVKGLSDNGPSIETIQLINRADRAVPYWKSFAEKFILPDASPGYQMVDLKDDFLADGVRRKAVVFTPDPGAPDKHQGDEGHGLSRYMELMGQLSSEDMQLLGDMLSISRNKRGAGAAIGRRSDRSQPGSMSR